MAWISRSDRVSKQSQVIERPMSEPCRAHVPKTVGGSAEASEELIQVTRSYYAPIHILHSIYEAYIFVRSQRRHKGYHDVAAQQITMTHRSPSEVRHCLVTIISPMLHYV